MLRFKVSKIGYTKKSIPILAILDIKCETETDKEVLQYYIDNGFIKKTVRNKYPQFRSLLEDDYNKSIASMSKRMNINCFKIHGFSVIIELVDYED